MTLPKAIMDLFKKNVLCNDINDSTDLVMVCTVAQTFVGIFIIITI